MKKFKYFPLTEIFNIERGKRYKRSDHVEGENHYISSTGFNNGIDNYVGETDRNKAFQNFIGLNNSGSIGRAFYHTKPSVVSDHVTMLTLKNRELNVYIALYLIGIIEQLVANYGFGREMSDDRLKKEEIALPVNVQEEVDYDYMENFIKGRAKKVTFKKKKKDVNYKYSLKSKKWKKFELSSLFEITGSGKSFTQSDILKTNQEGEYYYITTKATNNGVHSRTDQCLNEGNVITVDSATEGIVFYQEKGFVSSDHIEKLILKDRKLNVFKGLFIVSILNYINQSLYGYGRKRSQTRLKREYINLPVNDNDEVDWEFIELYMNERAKNIYF